LNSADALLEDLAATLYPWVVDISGTGGNPTFDLSKGQEFYFSIVQNGTTGAGVGAGVGGSFKSESFTIANSFTSSGMPTTPSSASRSRGLSKGVLIGIGIGLVTILGIGA
jgi:hypothetical protein